MRLPEGQNFINFSSTVIAISSIPRPGSLWAATFATGRSQVPSRKQRSRAGAVGRCCKNRLHAAQQCNRRDFIAGSSLRRHNHDCIFFLQISQRHAGYPAQHLLEIRPACRCAPLPLAARTVDRAGVAAGRSLLRLREFRPAQLALRLSGRTPAAAPFAEQACATANQN